MKTLLMIAFCLLTVFGFSGFGNAQDSRQDVPKNAEKVESEFNQGTTVSRSSRSLFLTPSTMEAEGKLQIPRFAASLKRMMWQGEGDQVHSSTLSMTPEQEYWTIQWKGRTETQRTIVLQFDTRPLLIDEIKPVTPSGDGSFFLPAHLARIKGEKVRYEPQSYKNTVGYWTGKQDNATWRFTVNKPGKFNVAILQGCGKGQGGSSAQMVLSKPASGADVLKSASEIVLEFEVAETGHFQNFQWRHLGTLEIGDTGTYSLRIAPITIKKAALMDVRAINLTRLPD